MRRFAVRPEGGFAVLHATGRSQAATMQLGPGEATGGPDNRHAASDQWLYVLEGRGEARVEGESVPLDAGVLLLIAAGEAHRIAAAEDSALKTLNIYAPPAY